MNNRIILCEPEQWGFTHSVYNAALLETVLLAYPETAVVFMAESEHLEWVHKELTAASPEHDQRVTWQAIAIPRRGSGVWKVMRDELAWCRRVFEVVSNEDPRFLILCSLTDSGLLVLKLLMLRRRTQVPVVAVPHGILSTVAATQSSKPWRRVINLRQVLRLPHPRSLRLIALGESIQRFLAEIQPKAAAQFRPLDLAYFWARHDLPEINKPSVLRFGYFGVNSRNKGFDTFFRLACETQRHTLSSEFIMVGFIRDPGDCPKYGKDVIGVSSTPLSDEEFARRADSLTYAVWTGNPPHYRLTASASFLDALSYIKPGIYLKNPFVEHYFERMGDIGYLCDTYEEMRELVLSIDKEFPTARYRRQCENILRGRSIFEPEVLAPRLRLIVDELESSNR